LFVPLVVILSFLIMWPFEALHNRRFVKKASEKIKSQKELITIGITGSFGKTTVKNILYTMLSTKFKVVATPYSYNTPLGLSKTILEDLKPNTEIFIAEMGARYVGDIKELSEMVEPKIGLITGLGNQHLATFVTIDNLRKTKFELAEYVWSKNGKMFFSNDNSQVQEYVNALENKGEFISSGLDSGRLYAKDISFDKHGSKFKIVYEDNSIEVQTKLLGKHNISNILLCASVAISLGLTLDEIASSIALLNPTAHRLAIVPSSGALTIIDDAYNGSVEGSRAALDVLNVFEGKKFVITPGLVELGKEQFNSNFAFGKEMAQVVDYCIITGITNYDAISNGLEFGGFDTSHILRAGSVKQAVELVSTLSNPGDVCLFENDLPDTYV